MTSSDSTLSNDAMPTGDDGSVDAHSDSGSHDAGASDGASDMDSDVLGDGSTVPTLIANASSSISDPSIAIDGTFVYFAQASEGVAGAIFRCPFSGCPDAGATEFVGNQDAPGPMVVSGNNLYWLDRGGEHQTGTLQRCGTTTRCLNSTTLATGLDGDEMILAPGGLAWTDPHNEITSGSTNETIVTGTLDGGSPTAVVSNLQSGSEVQTDGTNLYWFDALNVRSCNPAACGGGTVVATAPVAPFGLRVSSTMLTYATLTFTNDATMIYACNPSIANNCMSPTLLYEATNIGDQVTSAVVIDSNLYFLQSSSVAARTYLAMCPLDGGCGGANENLTVITLTDPTSTGYPMAVRGHRLAWLTLSQNLYTLLVE